MSEEAPRPAAVIVGAGIAGLSAAWELTRRGVRDFCVLQAGAEPGGVMRTAREDGFVMEAGPDSFLTAKSAAADLCAELGLAGELIGTLPSPGAQIYHGGQLHPLPAGWRMGLPTQLQPVLDSSLFPSAVKAQMARRWDTRVAPLPDESAAAYLRRRFGQRAGQALADAVAGPMLAGVYGGDIEQLSAAEMLPAPVSPSVAGKSVFTSLRAGMGQMVDTLSAQLPGGAVRLRSAAVSVIALSDGYRVDMEGGEWLETPRVILAVPAWAAAELVHGLDGGLATLLAAIPYASSVNVNVAYGTVPALPPGHGFLVSQREKKHLLACTFVHQKFAQRAPVGAGLVRLFYGGEVAAWPESRIEALALVDLRGMLKIADAPQRVLVSRWPRAMAQYTVGHGARLATITAAMASHPGLALAGNACQGVGVPDCIASGRAAAAANVA